MRLSLHASHSPEHARPSQPSPQASPRLSRRHDAPGEPEKPSTSFHIPSSLSHSLQKHTFIGLIALLDSAILNVTRCRGKEVLAAARAGPWEREWLTWKSARDQYSFMPFPSATCRPNKTLHSDWLAIVTHASERAIRSRSRNVRHSCVTQVAGSLLMQHRTCCGGEPQCGEHKRCLDMRSNRA